MIRSKKIQDFSQNMISYLNQMKEEFPKPCTYHTLLAQTHYEAGEEDLALHNCEQALILDSNNKKMILLKDKITFNREI